jgi:hypothetical protein
MAPALARSNVGTLTACLLSTASTAASDAVVAGPKIDVQTLVKMARYDKIKEHAATLNNTIMTCNSNN